MRSFAEVAGGDTQASRDDEPDADEDDTFLRRVAAAPDVPVVALAPGVVVQGRFRTEAPIGRGGMAVVWRALDLQLGRDVALKLEHRVGGDLGRMRQEARALASLSHPNVVTVLGVGLHDGAMFIAMELVEGGNARQWLHAHPRSWQQIVALYRQAGAGLAAAHGVGIVHRDFKPDNVLVGVEPDGSLRARVADFGIARAHEQFVSHRHEPDASASDTATTDLAMIGTPAYMAPEQLGHRVVDARADQFAFCVALWEALFGERPSAHASASRARRVPAWLQRVLRRGLAHDPDRRWRTMDELLAQLERPRRVGAVWLVVPGAAAIALAWGLARGDSPRCVDAGDSGWTPARTEAIEHALRATELPGIAEAAVRVRRRLDEHAAAWTQSWARACASEDASRFDATLACLRERREELATALDVLAAADRRTAGRLAGIEEQLADPRRCLDDPGERSPPTPEVEQARAALAEVRVVFSAGRYEDALALVEPVLAEAQRLDDRPLLAAAFVHRGRIHFARTDYEAAAADFEESYMLALAERLDDLAMKSAAQAAGAVDALGRTHDALTWCANARALSGSPAIEVRSRVLALTVEAHVLAYTTELERAEADAREAVALYDDDAPESHRADALAELAHVLYRRGDFAGAIETQRATLAMVEHVHGADHPRVAAGMEALGLYALHGDRRAESRVYLERALGMLSRWFGPDDPVLVEVLSELAHLDSIEGHGEEALAGLERARRIAIASGRPEIPTLADLDDVIGLALLGLDRAAEAVEVFRRELDAFERERGPMDPDLRFVLNNAAVAGRECGRGAEAELWLRRAIAIDDGLPEHDYQSAALHITLGFLLIDGGELDAAEAEIRTAAALGEHTMPPDDPDRAWPPFGFGRIARLRGQIDRAVPLLEQALARWDVGSRADGLRDLRRELALALWAEGRDRARALTLAREGLAEDPQDRELAEIVAARSAK